LTGNFVAPIIVGISPLLCISFEPAASYGLPGTGALAADFSKGLVMRAKMFTAMGKTTVVFFPTPIWTLHPSAST